MRISRKDFFKLSGIGLLGGIKPDLHPETKDTGPAGIARELHGTDLSGWKQVLGDGIYAGPGEPAVCEADIETVHFGSYSELRANVHSRRIMAHNITYQRITDHLALQYAYSAGFQFRLPYLPEKGNHELNAQTIEGGIFAWDGADTRRDYGLGFQWILNPKGSPEAKFGTVRCWTDPGGGRWENVGYLQPDTDWHAVRLHFDIRNQTTAFTINGNTYPACFTSSPKPASWGRELAAGIQVEIISIFPGKRGSGALHKAEFKDWSWTWEPF